MTSEQYPDRYDYPDRYGLALAEAQFEADRTGRAHYVCSAPAIDSSGPWFWVSPVFTEAGSLLAEVCHRVEPRDGMDPGSQADRGYDEAQARAMRERG